MFLCFLCNKVFKTLKRTCTRRREDILVLKVRIYSFGSLYLKIVVGAVNSAQLEKFVVLCDLTAR